MRWLIPIFSPQVTVLLDLNNASLIAARPGGPSAALAVPAAPFAAYTCDLQTIAELRYRMRRRAQRVQRP